MFSVNLFVFFGRFVPSVWSTDSFSGGFVPSLFCCRAAEEGGGKGGRREGGGERVGGGEGGGGDKQH